MLLSNYTEREKKITFVLVFTLFLNLVSASLKLWAGETFNYFSLVTSGVESIFDGSSNLLALVSLFIAAKPADDKHPYGHSKYETVASLLIAVLLLFSSYEMGKEVFHQLSTANEEPKHEFPLVPLLCLGISMMVSMFVSWYEGREGKRLNSPILEADSKHTFGDFLISFAVAISLLSTYWGYHWMDGLVGGMISVYLIFLAFKILKMNIDELVDATPFVKDKEVFHQVKKLDHVHDIHEIRARGSSRTLYVDFHLLLDDDLPLIKAHEIAHKAEDLIRNDLIEVARRVDITVHIEPYREHMRMHHDVDH